MYVVYFLRLTVLSKALLDARVSCHSYIQGFYLKNGIINYQTMILNLYLTLIPK